jgi:RNA polymerase sigma-70 factor, ECF subfamily
VIVSGEADIKRLFDRRDFAGATTAALRLYGPEILGLLCSMHRDEDEAGDAFSQFAERLWTSMERFEWKCSMRTWAYVLARRASHDVRRAEHRHEKRGVSLSAAEGLDALVAKVRTATLTILRTETKTALQKLREELPDEDQLLLVLRVDRQLAWDDLARVFDSDADPKKESARLRKRFQLVKEKLFALGKERGLIEG